MEPCFPGEDKALHRVKAVVGKIMSNFHKDAHILNPWASDYVSFTAEELRLSGGINNQLILTSEEDPGVPG